MDFAGLFSSLTFTPSLRPEARAKAKTQMTAETLQ
jgi:hypothetical protein